MTSNEGHNQVLPMGNRRSEANEKRKLRLEDNDRKKRARADEADQALDDMVKQSIEKHGA